MGGTGTVRPAGRNLIYCKSLAKSVVLTQHSCMLNWGQWARPALPPAGTQQECSRDLACLRSQAVKRGPKVTFAFIRAIPNISIWVSQVCRSISLDHGTPTPSPPQSRPSSSRVNYGEAETFKNLLAYHWDPDPHDPSRIIYQASWGDK